MFCPSNCPWNSLLVASKGSHICLSFLVGASGRGNFLHVAVKGLAGRASGSNLGLPGRVTWWVGQKFLDLGTVWTKDPRTWWLWATNITMGSAVLFRIDDRLCSRKDFFGENFRRMQNHIWVNPDPTSNRGFHHQTGFSPTRNVNLNQFEP